MKIFSEQQKKPTSSAPICCIAIIALKLKDELVERLNFENSIN